MISGKIHISLLSNGTSFVNFDAILRKLQLFSDGRLEEKNLCISATLIMSNYVIHPGKCATISLKYN
jgi:hypothetical protein